MARNSELIRQWEILRDIDGARNGITIAKLAAMRGVHQRTIRRDIDALNYAGFPLRDEKVNGTTMWKLSERPFRGLEQTGLGVVELCALYFSRTMLATLAGTPYQDDVDRAFGKLTRALPESCRKFLDSLPAIVKAKAVGRKKQDARKTKDILTRATDAIMNTRRVTMRYFSKSSRRAKEYLLEPLRVSYADGGVYLTGWVPEYKEMRNFAVERIQTLAVGGDQFTPRPLPSEPFADSIGVNSGTPERVEIEFTPETADYIAEREWHRSQQVEERADGSVLLRLDVCVDRPLRTWVLGFGPQARVLTPQALAYDIAAALDAARGRYPQPKPRMARMSLGDKPARRARTS
jgi:predicted DNA-binding transcriptional regulator YafY